MYKMICWIFPFIFALALGENSRFLKVGIDSPSQKVDLIIPVEGIDELIPLLVISYYSEKGDPKTTIIKELTPKDLERILKGETIKKKVLTSYLESGRIIIENKETKTEFPKELAQNIIELFQGKRLSICKAIDKEYKIVKYGKEGITTTSMEIIKKHKEKDFSLSLENVDLKTEIGLLSILMLNKWLFEFVNKDKDRLVEEISEEEIGKVPAEIRKNLKRKIDFSKIFEIFYKGVEIKIHSRKPEQIKK